MLRTSPLDESADFTRPTRWPPEASSPLTPCAGAVTVPGIVPVTTWLRFSTA